MRVNPPLFQNTSLVLIDDTRRSCGLDCKTVVFANASDGPYSNERLTALRAFRKRPKTTVLQSIVVNITTRVACMFRGEPAWAVT